MSQLDDFFAKKDRKKSKGKKFTTADEIAKKLEESGKRTEKNKKDKLQSSAGQDGEDPGLGNQEEDEWKDFEEEKKDYTGLKIQNLTLMESETGEDSGEGGLDGEEGEMEENEAGELVPRRKVQAGPWKLMQQQQQQAQQAQQQQQQQQAQQQQNENSEIKPVEKKEEAMRGGTGSYLPPHVRNLSHQTASAHSSPRLMKSKAAPDVNNEELFPTLSAAKSVEPAGAWGKKKRDEGVGFEEVRNSKSHSSRYADTAARMNPGKLALGNKYGALTHDQS